MCAVFVCRAVMLIALIPPWPRMPVASELIAIRAISAVFGLATLWVCWCATRESLGQTGAAIVTALLALHPQFAVVATTASPDALINLAGACVWWMAIRA